MFILPDLPYAYDALEPVIDAETMKLHHGKHHATYVAKLNDALTDHPQMADLDIHELLQRLNDLPESIRSTVQNNGGGHANHSLFWAGMKAGGSDGPDDALSESIASAFNSFDDFKEQFNAAATARFGSGWAWLVLDHGNLRVTSTANQDSPVTDGCTPLLGLDVWEHAYYLKYQNRRPDYISAWWDIVDWSEVGRRFAAAL